MQAKKATQLHKRRTHAGSGNCICLPIIERIRFFENANWDTASAAANIQYSTVGFHWMKVLS